MRLSNGVHFVALAFLAIALAFPTEALSSARGEEENRDQEVLIAAAQGLLSDPKFSFTMGRDTKKPAAIVVGPTATPFSRGTLSEDTLRSSLKESPRKNETAALVESLFDRNARVKSPVPIQRDALGIIWGAPTLNGLEAWGRFSKQFPTAKGAVSFGLPGFSSDGTTAVVFGSAGPFPHPGFVTILLKREAGGWKAYWQHVTVYQ